MFDKVPNTARLVHTRKVFEERAEKTEDKREDETWKRLKIKKSPYSHKHMATFQIMRATLSCL